MLVLIAMVARVAAWGYCNDKDVSCANWAKAGSCETTPHIKKSCPHSCGVCDHLCKDLDESCVGWAAAGHCEDNVDFMFKNCPVACGVCMVKCLDANAACGAWARDGECKKNPSLLSTCPASCGTCTDLCLDKKADCPQWAAAGDCGTNEGYMLKECPRSCQLCTDEHHKQSTHPVSDSGLTDTKACADLDRKQCIIWGDSLCETNPGAMLRDCPHTCGVCTLACEDKYSDCANWASKDTACEANKDFMLPNCPMCASTFVPLPLPCDVSCQVL